MQCKEIVTQLSEYNNILTTSTGNLYMDGKYTGRTPWFDEEEKMLNTIL